MFDLQLAFQTIVLIVLVVLVANLYATVRALRAEIRRLTDAFAPQDPSAPKQNQATPRAPVDAPPPPKSVAVTPSVAAQPAPARHAPTPPVAPQQQRQAPVPPPELTQGQPSQAQPSQAQPPNPTSAEHHHGQGMSLENVLGTRVLGILAALLVFSGLVFLAILVVPALSDEVRCAAMFVLSALLTGSGAVIAEKRTSPFSQALLGCGLGSVFVSLLVTYVYFGFLSDIPTMVLMLLWLLACTFMAQRHKSVALVIVAQLGMAISTCFAYTQGIESGQLPVVVAYQLMACVIVVVGCLRSLERGRMAGIFVSVVVSLVVSNLMVTAFPLHPTGFGRMSLIGTLVAQFVCVSVLTRLACVLPSPHSEPDSDGTTAPTHMATHITAEILWLVACGLDVVLCALLASTQPDFGAKAHVAAYLGVGCIVLRWIVTAILQKSQRIGTRQAFASIYIYAVAAALLLAWRMVASVHASALPLVALVGIALWLCGAVLQEPRHQANSIAFLITDAILMINGGYEALSTYLPAPAVLAYVILLDMLLFAWWRTLPSPARENRQAATLICGIIATEVSLFCAWLATDLAHELAVMAACACCIVLVAALAFVEPQRRWQLSERVGTALHVNEFVVVGLCCAGVLHNGPAYYARIAPAAPAVAVGICIVAAGVVFYRVLSLALHPGSAVPWMQVLAGISLTLWSTSTAQGILPAGMGAVVTIACMLSSLLCIALGFARKLGALRLYGLVTTILFVIIIVTIYVSGSDPIGRVIAFIVGGLICFAISALYTVAVRRLR